MSNPPVPVLLMGNFTEEQVDLFQGLVTPGVELSTDREREDYSILIGGRLEEEILDRNPGLIAAIIPWAGIPDSYYTFLKQPKYSHIAPHNSHFHAAIVAEYAFGMMFGIAKDFVRKDSRLRQGDWRPRYAASRGLTLQGQSALVMGYGAIGSEIGRLCQAIGMTVVGTKRHIETPVEVDGAMIHSTADLKDLLPACDVLFNALPLTAETEGLIGKEELALLKSTAIMVNIGRAKTFDEKALYEALSSEQLHGAALDVWYNYPSSELSRTGTFPASYPFHHLDNVLMSPHNSGPLLHSRHMTLRVESLADMLNTYVDTGTLPNRVDLKRGY